MKSMFQYLIPENQFPEFASFFVPATRFFALAKGALDLPLKKLSNRGYGFGIDARIDSIASKASSPKQNRSRKDDAGLPSRMGPAEKSR